MGWGKTAAFRTKGILGKEPGAGRVLQEMSSVVCKQTVRLEKEVGTARLISASPQVKVPRKGLSLGRGETWSGWRVRARGHGHVYS